MLQIYFPPNKHNSGVNNNPIKPQSYGENGYAYADIRKLMYSQPPTNRTNSKGLTYQKSSTKLILPVLAHIQHMEAQMDTSKFLFGSG